MSKKPVRDWLSLAQALEKKRQEPKVKPAKHLKGWRWVWRDLRGQR